MLKRPFYKFTSEDDAVWSLLYKRQNEHARRYAVQLYLEGAKTIGLNADSLPDFVQLDALYQERVGWELVSTDVQYSDGQSWFEHLLRKQFLITEYIRERDSLDYTPLPDIWHDTFGHLPYMTHLRYTEIIRRYAALMLNCPPEARKGLGSVWWYTIEFGLMKENGQVKAFGAGLLSSYGELQLAFSDAVRKLPFDPVTMAPIAPSPHEMHKTLWILEDLEQLEEFVERELRTYGIRA